MRRAPVWVVIAGGVVAGGLALDAVGLPSFAALLLGLAIALARPDRVALPPVAFRAAQAVAGVTLGAYLQADALEAVAGALAPVLLVSAATLERTSPKMRVSISRMRPSAPRTRGSSSFSSRRAAAPDDRSRCAASTSTSCA